MITNNDARSISGNMKLEHEKYTVTDGNLIKLVQQAICAYKHPEMSVIREYAVNGRDAMKLHNVDRPIEVTTPSMLSPKLTIRDYGGGMTEEETKNLLFSFGASGQEKQTSNRYVGGFGIGSKSAFNLSDSFLFSVFYKGTVTTWQCMLDEENFPTAAKMTSVPTDEADGVLVVIPSKVFDEDEALNALKWLDVPVKLNGKLVEPYRAKSQMSGTTSFKTKEGTDLEVKWDIVPKQFGGGGDITFVVGCGAIYVTHYRLPNAATTGVSIPGYFSGKFVIELPVGSVTLMTSREDFVYNDRTNYVIRNAMRAVIDDAHDKIMQKIYEAPDTRTMLDRLAELRKIYDGYGFNTLVGSCIRKIRQITNLDELKSELCRELEISESNGIDIALVSYPSRYGRSYSPDYKYKTSNLANGRFDGNYEYGGPHIWRAMPADMWKDSFLNEFGTIAQFGRETPKILVGTPTMFDKEHNDNHRIIFEGLGWKNIDIQVYPSGTKKFIGHSREYISSFGKNISKTAPVILTLCGNIDLIKDNVVKLFPGASVTYHTDVETFKTFKPGVRRRTKTGKIITHRKLWGWIANIVPDKIDLNDPEDIVFTMLREHTEIEISTKTSFMDYEGSEKPIFYINVEDAKDRMDEYKVMRKIRHAVINLLLGKADVLKDKNGIPVVALINMFSGAPKIGVPFTNGEDDLLKTRKIDDDSTDRYAMWLYRLLAGDKEKDTYRGSRVVDASGYAAGTGLKTYDGDIAEIKCGAKLLEYLAEELQGKRLHPSIRQAIDDIKLLFTPPKQMPYTQHPAFTPKFLDGSSKFVKAYKNLFSGIPVAAVFMDKLSIYDRNKVAWLKDSAADLATLIIEKSRKLSARKEVKDDNKQ